MNTGTFGIQPLFDYSNNKLVRYTDPHCIINNLAICTLFNLTPGVALHPPPPFLRYAFESIIDLVHNVAEK